jgi:hypothetical protein
MQMPTRSSARPKRWHDPLRRRLRVGRLSRCSVRRVSARSRQRAADMVGTRQGRGWLCGGGWPAAPRPPDWVAVSAGPSACCVSACLNRPFPALRRVRRNARLGGQGSRRGSFPAGLVLPRHEALVEVWGWRSCGEGEVIECFTHLRSHVDREHGWKVSELVQQVGLGGRARPRVPAVPAVPCRSSGDMLAPQPVRHGQAPPTR